MTMFFANTFGTAVTCSNYSGNCVIKTYYSVPNNNFVELIDGELQVEMQ